MNYTTNYNLPQWEEADRVTRGDVNDAMAVIDAAIANAGGGLQLLKTVTTTYDSSSVTIDVSDVDFSAWRRVHLIIYFSTGTGAWKPRFNSVTVDSVNATMNWRTHITLDTFCNRDMGISGILAAANMWTGFSVIEFFKSLNTVTLLPTLSNYTFPAGGVITIYGEK